MIRSQSKTVLKEDADTGSPRNIGKLAPQNQDIQLITKKHNFFENINSITSEQSYEEEDEKGSK